MSSKLSQLPEHPNNIRKAIKRSGLKFYEVVEETEIPRGTLNDYCAGKLPVPRERLQVLSDCLQCSKEYLVPPLPRVRDAYGSHSQSEETKDLEALLVLRTHCQQHPTDENALQQLLELLGKFGYDREIEECYEHFLKAVKKEDFWREPDACTTQLLIRLRTQVSVSVSSPVPEKRGQAAQTNEAVSPETASHSQEALALPRMDSPFFPIPSTPQIPSFTSPQPMLSPSSFNASPQGIISGEPDAQQLNARNLKSSYLALSTDIIGSLKAYSTRCQEELTTGQQQKDVYETIEQRCTMNDEHITDLSQMTRRDLFTLASVSSSLVLNMRRGWPPAGILEEFLSEVTASVTTCWYLLQRSDGLPLVEWAVPQYLPELVEVVKQYPRSRQRAAYLAAQGFLLYGLVAHHRVHYAEHVAHCQQAVTYAHEAGDLTLLVASLEHLSSALLINGQLDESLRTYLQAKGYSESAEVSGLSRSMVLAGLGPAYAQQGKSQEVVRCLGEAYVTFTEPDDETPVFLRATNDLYQIIQEEGRSTLALGNLAQTQGNTGLAQKYYKDAAETFGKLKQLPSGVLVPARIDAEIEIARAKAYALVGDMDGFITSFKEGVRMAKVLGSNKRMREAREAYILARKRWPHEQQIIDLWELLI